MTTIVTIVANPRRGSRTHGLAATVTAALATAVGAEAVETVDLAEIGPRLLDHGDEEATQARDRVAAADLVVVATPVYKATYTGLLKVFLDGYGADALASVTALGVIVSAAPHHLLSTDIHLRSLLVELGAAVPTRSVQITEAQLSEAAAVVDAWVDGHADRLGALVRPRPEPTLKDVTA